MIQHCARAWLRCLLMSCHYAGEGKQQLCLLGDTVQSVLMQPQRTACSPAPVLVPLVRSDQPGVQPAAASALQPFTLRPQVNRDASLTVGAVPLLSFLLQSGRPVVTACIQGNAEFCSWHQTWDAIIPAGTVPLLVTLHRPDQPTMQQHAAALLIRLATGTQQHKDAMMISGAVPLLGALGHYIYDFVPHTVAKCTQHSCIYPCTCLVLATASAYCNLFAIAVRLPILRHNMYQVIFSTFHDLLSLIYCAAAASLVRFCAAKSSLITLLLPVMYSLVWTSLAFLCKPSNSAALAHWYCMNYN